MPAGLLQWTGKIQLLAHDKWITWVYNFFAGYWNTTKIFHKASNIIIATQNMQLYHEILILTAYYTVGF